MATSELLGFLGRDEDLLLACDVTDFVEVVAPEQRAIFYHWEAFVRARQGDTERAEELWKTCLELRPGFVPAVENLADLTAGDGHAPWLDSFIKWVRMQSWAAFWTLKITRIAAWRGFKSTTLRLLHL